MDIKRTAEINQRDPRLRRHTIDAHDADESSNQERSSNLQLLARLHLQPLEHEHGQTHGDNVRDCIETSHHLELAVQLYTV